VIIAASLAFLVVISLFKPVRASSYGISARGRRALDYDQKRWMTAMASRIFYVGYVHGKDGRMLYKSQMYPTRIEAAADCFGRWPRVRECSTARTGITSSDGLEFCISPNEIRWHRRWKPKP
jgi:hypothetical protein